MMKRKTSLKTVKDAYKNFYVAKEKTKKVSYSVYSQIVNEFHKYFMEKVLEGEESILPCRMGSIFVKGRKPKVSFEEGKIKGLAPDWVKTKELWDRNKKAKEDKKLVYHMNEHCDSTIYKYLWIKKRVLCTNKSLYSLRMTRENKRMLSSNIKINKKEYREYKI